ncbi:tripartite tricarboxylate transporter substrate binding protein [Cupriavidus sp. PET2-C1]
MFKKLLAGATLLLACCFSAQAKPPGFPSRPIKLVVPWPSGGPTDAIARLVSEKLSVQVGQPVIVENRSGANGIVGTTAVSRAPADGYTLMLALPETNVLNPLVYKTISYRVEDLQALAFIGVRPFALVAGPTYMGKSISDVLRIARRSPESVSAASWGIGSTAHLAIASLEQSANVHLLHVPFPGTAAASAQLLGGQVDLMMLGLQPATEYANAGKLSILGISAPQRLEAYPAVPTLAEQGLDVDVSLWYGIAAPANTPAPIADYLNHEINRVLQDPAVLKGLRQQGMVVRPQSRGDFSRFIDTEFGRWSALIKRKNIQIDN